MTRVFISHSSNDLELVKRELIEPLEAHGVRTWYAERDIPVGADWDRSLQDGLKSCDWFLATLTQNAARSPWVYIEIQKAFKLNKRIVPVLLEDCDLDAFPLSLDRFQFFDFRRRDPDAFSRLLAIWPRPEAAPTDEEEPAPPSPEVEPRASHLRLPANEPPREIERQIERVAATEPATRPAPAKPPRPKPAVPPPVTPSRPTTPPTTASSTPATNPSSTGSPQSPADYLALAVGIASMLALVYVGIQALQAFGQHQYAQALQYAVTGVLTIFALWLGLTFALLPTWFERPTAAATRALIRLWGLAISAVAVWGVRHAGWAMGWAWSGAAMSVGSMVGFFAILRVGETRPSTPPDATAGATGQSGIAPEAASLPPDHPLEPRVAPQPVERRVES